MRKKETIIKKTFYVNDTIPGDIDGAFPVGTFFKL